MKKKLLREFGGKITVLATLCIVLSIMLSITASATNVQVPSEEGSNEMTRSDNYLTAAMQSPIENLNPLTISDVWSSYAARGPIYSGLSGYHQDSEQIIPYMAYDWSPLGESGSYCEEEEEWSYDPDNPYDPTLNYDADGNWDPSQAYISADGDNLDTVANFAIPSADLEVVVRMRAGIPFHRSDDWTGTWTSPKNPSFTLPMETMRYATSHDIVFAGEMLQWTAPLYQSSFLYLIQDPVGDRRDARDPNWVVNGGTGMYEGMQLYSKADHPDLPDYVCDYSIRFELDRPYATYEFIFPMSMSMNIWAEHTLLDTGANAALSWDLGQGSNIQAQRRAMVGNGAFMWTDWDPGNYIRLDTNPDYWIDGTLDPDRPYGLSLNGLDYRPWIDGLEFIIRSTTDAAILSLERGEVDVLPWPVDPGYITRVQQNPDLDVMSTPDFGFFYMAFNLREPAFGYKDYPGAGEQLGTWYGDDLSLNFRKAVTHATDKSYIVNNLLQGYGAVGWSVVSPDNNLYHNRTVTRYPFDIAETKRLMEVQNQIWRDELDGFNTVWRAEDAPGRAYPIPRRDAGGNIYEDTSTFYLLTPTADYDPIRAKAGQLVADTLREETGLNIQARPMIFQTLVERLDPGRADFDIYMLGWSIGGFDSLGSLQAFFHSRNDIPGAHNMPGMRSERFDDVVERAEREMNPTERVRLVMQLQGIISENLAYNVLYFRSQVNGYRNEWDGWVAWPGGIWNGFSHSNVRRGSPEGGLTMAAPSDVSRTTQHDVTIRLTDAQGNPQAGESINLQTTHTDDGAVFQPKGATSITDPTGVLNATFTAPDIAVPTVVTLTAELADGSMRATRSINVYPTAIPKLYLTASVDLDIIKYDDTAIITLELQSDDPDVDNVTVSVSVTPDAGNPQMDRTFPLDIVVGQPITINFQAPEQDVDSIRRYTVEFEAVRTGYESSIRRVSIMVEGPEEKDDDTTPSPGILPFLLGAAGIACLVHLMDSRRGSKKSKNN